MLQFINCSEHQNFPSLQAGTYIKEFVHGDGGRTTPNLGSLLSCDGPAEIIFLDVLEVHMDFIG
jgi:tRNA pseudouridine synthase 10